MIQESSVPITDLNYIDYHYKQWKELTYEQQVFRANNTKLAGNFSFEDNQWTAQPYYGFGMISLLNHQEKNYILSQLLFETQLQLMSLLEEKTGPEIHEKIYLLPEDSFHQTIANALSNLRYDQHITDQNLTDSYPSIIHESLQQYKSVFDNKTIRMKMIGLGIFGNALGVLGVFNDPYEYNSIVNFRNHFYQHKQIKNLGIQQTRPFIGHITLAYLESDLSLVEKKALVETTTIINEVWQNEKNIFYIDQTCLTSFSNMASFKVTPNIYPIYF